MGFACGGAAGAGKGLWKEGDYPQINGCKTPAGGCWCAWFAGRRPAITCYCCCEAGRRAWPVVGGLVMVSRSDRLVLELIGVGESEERKPWG